jgi:hypothetical protein
VLFRPRRVERRCSPPVVVAREQRRWPACNTISGQVELLRLWTNAIPAGSCRPPG